MALRRPTASLALQLEKCYCRTISPPFRPAFSQHCSQTPQTIRSRLSWQRPFSSAHCQAEKVKSLDDPLIQLRSEPTPSKIYTYEDIKELSDSPNSSRILIDVREPSELQGTGKIPTSQNIPISSSPDAFFLPADEFEDRFGFPRPGADVEVVFYCKAGVRSRAAARLAQQSEFGGMVGEFPGSWIEWEERGGKVERT